MVDILNPSNYFFNHHAVAPAFVALAVFCAGLYVFIKEKKELPNISFFIFCLTISIWLSGMALLYSTLNPKVADIIFRYYVFFGVSLMPPIFYLLTSSILNQLEKRRYIAINFIIAITFYIIDIKTDYIYSEIKKLSHGFYPIFSNSGPIFLLFFYGTLLICLRDYFRNIKNRKSETDKIRVKDILIGFSITVLGGIDYFLALGINIYPYGYLFIIIGLTYASHATPWFGVKGSLLLEQEDEDTFIVDDNINNKIPTRYGLQAFK